MLVDFTNRDVFIPLLLRLLLVLFLLLIDFRNHKPCKILLIRTRPTAPTYELLHIQLAVPVKVAHLEDCLDLLLCHHTLDKSPGLTSS